MDNIIYKGILIEVNIDTITGDRTYQVVFDNIGVYSSLKLIKQLINKSLTK